MSAAAAESPATLILAQAEQHAWEQVKKFVLDGMTSAHSKRAYNYALDHFRAWCDTADAEGFSKATVQAYRSALVTQGLSSSLINLRLSAIRKLAGEAADNRLLDVQSAAAISRVKSVKKEGVRAGNWLTRPQAQALLSLPNRKTNRGKRDRVILALFLGGGIRRDELATLDIKKIHQREGRWCIVDLIGKGNRVRTVPLPGWAKVAIDEWLSAASFTEGLLFGRVNKADKITGQGLSAQAVYDVIFSYQERLKALFAPHDLRRTHARLAYEGGADLKQLQEALGHASIKTTEQYVGARQDLSDAPCDYLKLRVR